MSGGCCVGDLYGEESSLCAHPVSRIVAGAIAGEGRERLAILLPVCSDHAPAVEAWLGREALPGKTVSFPVGTLVNA
jgi:hypothetical protein